ncbi:MAG TPA: cyclodeaminase/cyclohydrolase family protein [Vicinamibacterales bacterium]|nr:cyclodeaminase/cyclohydrolase family protein [Vicinamibacterales bacterium]
MLRDLALRDLLDAFSRPDPTPGGGSASALSSAVGASLLMMVAALPKTRHGSDADRDALAAAAGALAGIRDRLAASIDEDTAAYDGVVAAYRLPKGSADEQAERKAAIQRALRAATDVPLEVMRQSARALEEATVVAGHGYKSASSDVGVAIAMLMAGSAGAHLNVDVNLDAIADETYRGTVGDEARDLMERTGRIAQRAEDLLQVD